MLEFVLRTGLHQTVLPKVHIGSPLHQILTLYSTGVPTSIGVIWQYYYMSTLCVLLLLHWKLI